jgi:RNA polymerase sigma-70 factor (ECF subfamily)
MRLLGEREAATDAVQEAWLAIVRSLPKLDDPARFAPWAYRILRNKCADRLRVITRSRRRENPLDDAASTPDDEQADALEAAHQRADAVDELRAAIRRLPGEQRALLSLFYFEGLSVGQIAEALAIPPGTVKSRLFHLRARLRATMED